MGQILFVHGTGVRHDGFSRYFGRIEQAVEDLASVDGVRACFWGNEFGAKLEHGRSVPDYPTVPDTSPIEEAQWADETRWAILEFDPLYELRLMGLRAPEVFQLPRDHPGRVLLRDVEGLANSSRLPPVLRPSDLDGVWVTALDRLLSSDALKRATWFAEQDAIPERRAAGRAAVALAEHLAVRDGKSPPSPSDRQRLIDAVVHELGADVAGVISSLATGFATVVLGGVALSMAPTATWVAARKRGAVADGTAPMAGDILLYQARGQQIRDYIAASIREVDDEVILLGHSLGGIACVDLLVTDDLPQVSHLITVGSQAPFLHEIGALWSLQPGLGLPESFPPWLNVYDRKDLLSFVANPVFGARATDLEVDNRCSFPRSHSEYWRNGDVWTGLGRWLTDGG